MRGCALTLGCLGLLLGYAAAGSGVVATISYLLHEGSRAVNGAIHYAQQRDALSAELARCQRIGALAGDDPNCQAARSASRRRFLDYGPASSAGAPHS